MDTSSLRRAAARRASPALAALGLLVLGACAGPRATARPAGATPLLAADGAPRTLDEVRSGSEATVLVFWSAGCPCVRRYQARVDALLEAWPPGRVRVIGVSSNAGERFDEALREAAARGVRIPLYRDEGGRLAAAIGARTTPTVAVLDRAGEVRFLGWVDNERLPGDAGREPWLEQAVAGVLEGSSFAARSPVYGCAITRSLGGAPPSPCCAVP